MKHIIHCSGYSLAERIGASGQVTDWEGRSIKGKFFDWDFVCLGEAKRHLLGRIPVSINLARSLRADCIIWSTGATFLLGASEAEIMMKTAEEYLINQGQSVDWLAPISIIENKSTNTLSSMHSAIEILKDRHGAEQTMLHLITSSNHAPRVARDASIALGPCRSIALSIVPAQTWYGGTEPSEMTISDLAPSTKKGGSKQFR